MKFIIQEKFILSKEMTCGLIGLCFDSRVLSLLFLLVASPFFLTIARALRSQPIAQDHTTCTFPSCMQFYPTRKKPSYSCIHQLLAIVLLNRIEVQSFR